MINGISWLVVTKLDVLDELAEIPVCVGYRINGKKSDEIPAQASGYDKIECVYENKPGWKSSTQGITTMNKLPKQAREYLSFLETATRARVPDQHLCRPNGARLGARRVWMYTARSHEFVCLERFAVRS